MLFRSVQLWQDSSNHSNHSSSSKHQLNPSFKLGTKPKPKCKLVSKLPKHKPRLRLQFQEAAAEIIDLRVLQVSLLRLDLPHLWLPTSTPTTDQSDQPPPPPPPPRTSTPTTDPWERRSPQPEPGSEISYHRNSDSTREIGRAHV